MDDELLRYDKIVEDALRGVVRTALTQIADFGLPESHSFYIAFLTHYPGVTIPDHLRAEYPDEMTIVLEHQFWDLEVLDDRFRGDPQLQQGAGAPEYPLLRDFLLYRSVGPVRASNSRSPRSGPPLMSAKRRNYPRAAKSATKRSR